MRVLDHLLYATCVYVANRDRTKIHKYVLLDCYQELTETGGIYP